jgi:transcriptional regulator with XRE-family HTH domain
MSKAQPQAPQLLRVLRAQQQPKRFTQSDLARRVAAILKQPFSSQRYWQIENGEGSAPSDDQRAAIAQALGVATTAIAWPVILEQAHAS